MVLVDTSVWVSHLRGDAAQLSELLEKGVVATHPYVIGELACGRLGNRKEILTLMQDLPAALMAEHEEILGFLEAHELMGRGLCWVDAHLLASALLTGLPFWTEDEALADAAAGLNIAFG
jgi:predicted nucleic acid-binding protein